jgi:hypothetical protein
MADDIGRAGQDPRDVARGRQRAGRAARQRAAAAMDLETPRTSAGGSGGGGGGRALTVAPSSEPARRGGSAVAPRGGSEVTADRRIPLNPGNLGGSAARIGARAIPGVGALQAALSSTEVGNPNREETARAIRAHQIATTPTAADGPDIGTQGSRGRVPDEPAPRREEAPRRTTPPRPRTPSARQPSAGRELSADDLNAMVLERLGRTYSGDAPPAGAESDRARARIGEAMGMKKGGPVRKQAPVRMAKGGAVKSAPKMRGCGIAKRGLGKGRFV